MLFDWQPAAGGTGAPMMQPMMGQPMMGQAMMRPPFAGVAGAAPGAAAPGAPVNHFKRVCFIRRMDWQRVCWCFTNETLFSIFFQPLSFLQDLQVRAPRSRRTLWPTWTSRTSYNNPGRLGFWISHDKYRWCGSRSRGRKMRKGRFLLILKSANSENCQLAPICKDKRWQFLTSENAGAKIHLLKPFNLLYLPSVISILEWICSHFGTCLGVAREVAQRKLNYV